jgi:hypothetical protein
MTPGALSGNGMSAQMRIRFYLERGQFASVEKTPDRETLVGQHRFFLYLRTLNWVRTRQRQIDLLKKCGAESSCVHGHAPLRFQYVPHSTAAVTAFRFRFRHCLGSMRASMQGLGCVRHIYQQVAFIDLCQSEKREV